MNSNKIAVAVLILACAVIVSSLFAASVTEPILSEGALSEPNIESVTETSFDDASSGIGAEASGSGADVSEPDSFSADESVSGDASGAGAEDMSDAVSEESEEEPDEVISEDSEEESDETVPPEESTAVQIPEESSEEELIRDPLGGKDDGLYKVTVIVKDIEGFSIEGAEVHIDELVGETDETGKFYIELEEADFVLNVVSGAFVSYYEEVTLYEKTSVIEISLARADKIRRLLNSATLRPYVSNHAELDAAVNALFDELFEPGMDTYDKVKACYDWLIENTVYKRPYHLSGGYWQCAYQTITDGIGTCNCYSNAFAVMMRYIGLECYVVEGTTTANAGGYTGHEWTTVKINGEFYVFDPQVEDAIAGRNGGKVNYVRFCLPEPHVKYRYSVRSKDYYLKKFNASLEANGYYLED